VGVTLERRGSAAVVTLDWPAQRNSLGPDECNEITPVLAEAARDPAVCGVVLTGNGAFCAGGNMKGAADRTGMPEEQRRTIVYGAYQGMMRALVAVPVPTVAAVDGAAVGMGLDLALACDSRFIGPKGWVMQGWGRVGLVPGTGGVLLLQRALAPHRLWSLLEDQVRIDAAAAEHLCIAETSGDKPALERALERIEKLAPMSREALEAYVELSRAPLRRELEAHLAMAVERQLKLLVSPDFKRRAAAVLQK